MKINRMEAIRWECVMSHWLQRHPQNLILSSKMTGEALHYHSANYTRWQGMKEGEDRKRCGRVELIRSWKTKRGKKEKKLAGGKQCKHMLEVRMVYKDKKV